MHRYNCHFVIFNLDGCSDLEIGVLELGEPPTSQAMGGLSGLPELIDIVMLRDVEPERLVRVEKKKEMEQIV